MFAVFMSLVGRERSFRLEFWKLRLRSSFRISSRIRNYFRESLSGVIFLLKLRKECMGSFLSSIFSVVWRRVISTFLGLTILIFGEEDLFGRPTP